MRDLIVKSLQESIQAKQAICDHGLDQIIAIANVAIDSIRNGGKIMLFGNGGSAADSQHIAAEFVCRFKRKRCALPAMALHCDTSVLTAISNDYHYDHIFARQIEALGKKGDLAIGISTSGRSPNIIAAIKRAKELGIHTIGFTGGDGGELAKIVDHPFVVPSHSTPRIQESHITVGHILCELIEDGLHQAGHFATYQ